MGIKGFAGGFGTRMLGSFDKPAIKQFVAATVQEALSLENAMRRTPTQRTMVVLHDAPIAETVEGEPLAACAACRDPDAMAQ